MVYEYINNDNLDRTISLFNNSSIPISVGVFCSNKTYGTMIKFFNNYLDAVYEAAPWHCGFLGVRTGYDSCMEIYNEDDLSDLNEVVKWARHDIIFVEDTYRAGIVYRLQFCIPNPADYSKIILFTPKCLEEDLGNFKRMFCIRRLKEEEAWY